MTTWPPLLALTASGLVYVWLAQREADRRGWPAGRTLSFLSGTAVLVLALGPWFDGHADRHFQSHVAQHLLLAAAAPLLLVLAAPVTLLLRQLPHRHGRRLGRLLHRRSFRWLAHPAPGVLLVAGGTVALYATPLHELTTRHLGVHVLAHAYLLVAGLVLAWAVAGPDPAPRSGAPVRVVALVLVAAVHVTIGQLLHDGRLTHVVEPAASLQAGGTLLYFGGLFADAMLGVALVLTWRPAPRTRGRLARA